MYTLADFAVGQRVEISPSFDSWMRGDRYGEIVQITKKSIHVKLDKSGKVLRIPAYRPSGIYEIISSRNPRRKKRTRRNPVPAALAVLKAAEAAHYMRKNPKPRVSISGRKMKRSKAAKSYPRMIRSRIAGDPRKTKKALRRKGYRVNPKPRISFRPAKNHIRLQGKRGGSWITLALFPLTQKVFAVRIAKQHHRRHPGATLRLVA